ncbi:MAG: hypothetical protein J6J35_07200 [Alphaproteobacteria bacterium]|nr:hypothetical protein [Alphaproteobacteria bacterium]
MMAKDAEHILEKRRWRSDVSYYHSVDLRLKEDDSCDVLLSDSHSILYHYPKKEKAKSKTTREESVLPIPEIYL